MDDKYEFEKKSIPKGIKVGMVVFTSVIIVSGVTISVLLMNKQSTDTRSGASTEQAPITGPRGVVSNEQPASGGNPTNTEPEIVNNNEVKLSDAERQPLEWNLTGLTVSKEEMQIIEDDLGRADFDMLTTE
jgi:hypothetical protein